jgi:hypothetical protein
MNDLPNFKQEKVVHILQVFRLKYTKLIPDLIFEPIFYYRVMTYYGK